MIDLIRSGACCIAIAAFACASGCATIVKGTSQDISITTEPSGAACELSRDGTVFAKVDPTPGSASVNKNSRDISISCKKSGFVEASAVLESSFEGWTLGNIVIGGLIGVVIDFGSGAIHKYETELQVKLQPETFARDEQRDIFFDNWRTQVQQESERSKAEIRKNCKEQCDVLLAKVDAETTSSLQQIEAMRGSAQVKRTEPPASVTAPRTASAASVAIPPAAAAGPMHLSVGDRWKYRLSDKGRAIGFITVEIAQVTGGRVKERITRDGYPAFLIERDIQTQFAPTRFEPQVDLPGGYRLSEMAPYFPSETQFASGQRWADVVGQFEILGYGSKTFSSLARVVRREKVRVPAGEFDTWRIETTSPQVTGNSVQCTFWYALEAQRTVKMALIVNSSVLAAQTNDTYELAAFERGK